MILNIFFMSHFANKMNKMQSNSSILFYLIALNIILIIFASRICLNDNPHRNFYKVRKCHRSEEGVLSRNNFDTFKQCANFAREKNALAINYSPPEANEEKDDDEYFYNCEVLGCPESTNFTTLVNDTAYDYYSAFADYTVLVNATCIKTVGLFKLFHEKLNYTSAAAQCQAINADLAHILNEARNYAISNMVSTLTDFYKMAYIGLDDMESEGIYKTPLGDLIDCYKYRAWAPSQPRNVIKMDDCVVIDHERSWRIIDCRKSLPFVCEFYSMEAFTNTTNYDYIDCDDLDEEEEEKLCKDAKKKKNRKKKENRCEDED